VEGSLQRLKTDHIDLYQFHWPDPDTPVDESWKTMKELVKEGKVRSIGVCNFSVGELERCRTIAPVQSLQPPYNMLRREVEEELLPYCQSQQIGVVAYSPMASGLLTGSFKPDSLAPDDWRRKNPHFNEESRSKVTSLLGGLKPIANRYGISIGGLAIAWVLRKSVVTSAIVGARKQWQIEDTVSSSETELSSSDVRTIESLLKTVWMDSGGHRSSQI
jgi:aryl-alcohol dehydrogenase-like predicted oxidoreductase